MRPGDVIGDRYEIVGELGSGGSAEIWRVRDRSLDREAALKVIVREDPEAPLPGIREEAHLLAQLHHPGIVTVFDCGSHGGAFYLVMELVDGRTVTEVLREEELCLRDVLQLAAAVAEAMAFAHDRDIAHRDLTLNNIMLVRAGEGGFAAKVLDFGLGKRLAGGADALDGGSLGTMRFMPPEQFGTAPADERSDLYSFGVCLYRLLSGRFPFDQKYPAALQYQIAHEEAPPLPDSVPVELAELVGDCLQKDPERRPHGFRAFSARLAGIAVPTDEKGAAPAALGAGQRDGNPYLNRVMIQDMRDFIGRTREIRKIFSRLDAFPPQSISIVGDRRIGKSSLLNYIYHAGNRRRHMRNAADAVFVFLDFQSDIDFTAEHFLRLMMRGMPASCLDRGADLSAPTFRDLERAVVKLDGEGKRLIVLMDEFEKITGNANFEQGFFSFLRHLANHYNVAYVTSSESELMKMCHARVIADSPFFNIFSNLPLGPFTREEAHELVARPSAEAGAPLEPYADLLIGMGGRIPMYLQIVCSCFFEEAVADPDTPVTWERVRADCLAELRPHFEFMWERMPGAERAILADLAKDGKVASQQRHLAEDLRRRGLVMVEDGRERVFSKAFAEFVAESGAAGGSWLAKLFGRGRGK